MKVQCRVFESTTKSWDALVEEASTFATGKGRERTDQHFSVGSRRIRRLRHRRQGRNLRLVLD